MSVPSKSLVVSNESIWRVLAISAALAFAYASVVRKLVYDWWTDDNYSHGLLIPIAIGYIIWSQRARLHGAVSKPSTLVGGAAVLLALIALWAGIAGAELYLQRLSLVLILAGITVYLWGFLVLRHSLVLFVLLLLALPIPTIVFNKIAFPLQLFASRCAVWSMSLFSIPVLRQGNVIELLPLNASQTKKLEVVEACSGIRSLMTLMTLAVIFAYLTQGQKGSAEGGRFKWLRSYRFWRSAILVGSAIPIAIFTNALRVSGTGILAHYYGTEIADGFFHSFSGWVIYVVAFLLLFFVGWVLDRFNPSRRKRSSEESSSTARTQIIPAEGGGSGR
jgi:exosortase